MKVDKLLKEILERAGYPVARLRYRGTDRCYIVYSLLWSRDRNFSDDSNHCIEYCYNIHIFSKTDYLALIEKIRKDLKDAEFNEVTVDAEMFESDTNYYHAVISAKYMEV